MAETRPQERTYSPRGDAPLASQGVIVSLQVATGAAAGAVAGSPVFALALGPVLHVAADHVPHQDIPSRRFEIASGVASVALLAARRGPLDSATLGAIAASAPDLEHVIPALRPGGKKLFHRGGGRHRSDVVSTDLQLLVAGAILGLLVAPRRPGAAGSRDERTQHPDSRSRA